MFSLYKSIKNYSELYHEVRRSNESHERMHPWLAEAVPDHGGRPRVSFDLVNRTALSCIYILLYVPFSQYALRCARSRKRENAVGMRKERDKLRACVCTDGRGCPAIGALFAKYLPGYHKHNTVPQKFVRRPVSFI